MKDEIDYKSCETIEELKILIDDYMDYYNNERCQWNLKKLTPVQMCIRDRIYIIFKITHN